MKRIIHVRIFQGDKYFVAECFDLPIMTQAATLDELMTNVKEPIDLQLEAKTPQISAFRRTPRSWRALSWKPSRRLKAKPKILSAKMW